MCNASVFIYDVLIMYLHIIFFTTDGDYVEWNGKFLYTDIPVEVDAPVLKYEVAE